MTQTALMSALSFDLTDAIVHRNLSTPRLYEEALRRNEAQLAQDGPLVANTGSHTGRSPKDRFVVKRPASDADIDWGPVNAPISEDRFDALFEMAQRAVHGKELFVFEGFAGADPSCQIKVRIITEFAWHCIFAQNMFLRPAPGQNMDGFEPDFTVIDIPSLEADPEVHGTNSETFIVVDVDRHHVLIGGTRYAGEIKKSIFSVMNFLLPRAGVLSMHCSANYGNSKDDSALFFGLSGTGKTTLSSSPDRTLIGDDEHGWGDEGIFNIEGGCYAKVIRLDPEGEPEIYSTTKRFGTILENVAFDPETRGLDLDDDRFTENTRASYPLTHLNRVDLDGRAGHPRTVIFLTCDAFGVLPPVSCLNEDQTMYHFLSGYTAKVAGTERGVTEPQATFSACFGAPFMPLAPGVYAEMLGAKVRTHDAKVFLVNTGWTGGGHGVGRRVSLEATRRMIQAALNGELDSAKTSTHPIFGLEMPEAIEGIDSKLLNPMATWEDPDAYLAQAKKLAQMFESNFEQFKDSVTSAVVASGPKTD